MYRPRHLIETKAYACQSSLSNIYLSFARKLFRSLEQILGASVEKGLISTTGYTIWHPLICHASLYWPEMFSKFSPKFTYTKPLKTIEHMMIYIVPPKDCAWDVKESNIIWSSINKVLVDQHDIWCEWEIGGLKVAIQNRYDVSVWQWNPVKNSSGIWSRPDWRMSIDFEDVPMMIQGNDAIVNV